jgi:eukaryotic-like serine/threonine-protein kinase
MRLTTRLFLLISFLIALTVGTAVAVTLVLSARIGRQTITARLEKGDSLRTAQQEDLYDRLKLVANVFVADANLIAYVAEAQERSDSGSILDLLLERQDDLGFDFAVVTDPDGYVLARTDALDAAGEDLADEPLIARALADYQSAGLWRHDGKLYHGVVIPLVQGGIDLLGFFATAYPIDDFSAADSKRLDGSEVAYVAFDDGGRPHLVAASFDAARAPGLAAMAATWGGAAAADPAMLPVVEVEAAGEPWLVHRAVLEDPEGTPVALRLTASSLRRETAGFRRVGSALGAVGLASVLLGFVLTYLLARRLTRPLRGLVAAARQARGGQYDAEIPVSRKDEIGDLGRQFQELLKELREKRDMETYVAELSRNLPDPAPPQEQATREVRNCLSTVMALEYRQHAGGGTDPVAALGRLQRDLAGAASAVARSRGHVVAFAGHRLLAVFEGPDHPVRALKVAIDLCSPSLDGGNQPTAAIASGTVTVGSIEWQSQSRDALCGRPVQTLESLLREATPGEILLPSDMRETLFASPSMPNLELPERQGLTTTLRHCVVDASSIPSLPTLTFDTPDGRRPGAPIFEVGQVLADRFEILALAGMGGMGAVYRARDRKLGDVVALKTLRDNAWNDPRRVDRLKQEIKLARKITHPHVLRVYDLGEVDGIPFISMEYVRGVTLRQLLDKTQRLPFSAGMRLARQICLGLDAVHQAGILHHDMKPENVLLEPTGNARLMDFGISAPLSQEPGTGERQIALGTPYYLAPEQLSGGQVDARADLFGTGILLFELFTGTQPYRRGKNIQEILSIKIKEEPKSAADVWPEVPPALAALLARCLERDPANRFASATELIAALNRVA